MNWIQKTLTVLSAVILITVLGCSAWIEGMTPAFIDPAAIEYAETDPTVFTPYTSLWDARRIQREMNFQYFTKKVKAARNIEDIDMQHKHLNDAMQIHIASAEELRDTLISPTGPLSLLFAAVPALGLGAYLIPRPSDRKKIKDLENGNVKS